MGGKVIEKLLINIIMHYLYSKNLMNPNQYVFTPQTITTEATGAVKIHRRSVHTRTHHYTHKPRRTGGIRRGIVVEYITQPKNTRLPDKLITPNQKLLQ